MDIATVLVIAVPIVAVLAAVGLFAAARRTDTQRAVGHLTRETRKKDRGSVTLSTDAEGEESGVSGREIERAAEIERVGGGAVAVIQSAPPAPWIPPDEEALGATRRQFMNRSIIGLFILSLSGFGAAVLAFIWPQLGGGFGSKIKVGKLTDILSTIADTREPVYVPDGRLYLNPYPKDSVSAAEQIYSDNVVNGIREGVVALYQKCPHLGCRVPWCTTSQWFECPCHGSQYNRVGEKQGGPARGMDRFPVTVEGGDVVVDTGTVVQGPEIGVDTTKQTAEGPNCIGAASH